MRKHSISNTPKDIATICQGIRTYERETGAQLNPRKSKELTLGAWSAPITLLGIGLCPQI